MQPELLLRDAIRPAHDALTALTGTDMGGRRAEVMSLAVAFQETNVDERIQIGDDGKPLPRVARSWWQFERMGGVAELIAHRRAGPLLKVICDRLDIPFDRDTLHEAMAWNDLLAAVMARLLLWVDPDAIPDEHDTASSYAYYDRRWRPGAKRPEDWPKSVAKAVAVVDRASRPLPTLASAPIPESKPATTKESLVVRAAPAQEPDVTKDDVAAIVAAALAQDAARRAAAVEPYVASIAPAATTIAPPPGGMVVTPTEVVVPKASNPLKPDLHSLSFWVAIAFSVGPVILDMATNALSSNPALQNVQWIGPVIYGLSQLKKVAALIQLPTPTVAKP